MRWQDVISFAGFSMVVYGTVLLFPSSADGMNWKYMLGGFVLWLVGFVSVVGWLLWRWSVGASQGRQFRNEKSAAILDEGQPMAKKERACDIKIAS